jgi:hypothetical protein
MRVCTQQSTRSRSASSQPPSTRGRGGPVHSSSPEVATTAVGRVRKEQFALASRRCASPGHPPHTRLCGNLTHLQDHTNSAVTAIKRPHVCHVCGKPAYSKCELCYVTLHHFFKEGRSRWGRMLPNIS